MTFEYILTAAAGIVLGTAVAYVNMLISKNSMKAENMAGIMGGNALRLLLDALALAIAYFVSRALSVSEMCALIATAVGLSVGSIVFLKLMVKKNYPQQDNDGGEDH